jgi:hypothetical protein
MDIKYIPGNLTLELKILVFVGKYYAKKNYLHM